MKWFYHDSFKVNIWQYQGKLNGIESTEKCFRLFPCFSHWLNTEISSQLNVGEDILVSNSGTVNDVCIMLCNNIVKHLETSL